MAETFYTRIENVASLVHKVLIIIITIIQSESFDDFTIIFVVMTFMMRLFLLILDINKMAQTVDLILLLLTV